MVTVREHEGLCRLINACRQGADNTTPMSLVEEMIDKIPEEIWKDPSKTILDPAAGSGTFLVAAYWKMIQAGDTHENIIKNRLFACEVNLVYLKVLRDKLGLKNIYDKDFLQFNGNMKFDVVIGNPPFNETDTTRVYTNFKGQGRNLAKMFTQKAIELSKEYILFVQPYGHRTLSTKVERDYISAGLKRVINCTKYFPNVAQTLVYFIFVKNSKETYTNELTPTLPIPESNIAEYFINQPGKLSRFEYEDSLLEEGDIKVYVTTGKQLFTNDKDFYLKMQDKSYGKWRTVFNCTTTQSTIGKVQVASPTDVLSKSVHCLAFDTEKEATMYKEYLDKPETNELLAKVKRGMCNSKKFLQYIPTLDI